MPFGQVIIGPPGSGKTTYCRGMKEFLEGLNRKVVIVNLDPANETLPYNVAVDISELINLEDAMREENLGPNGAMIYCLEFLEKNIEWLLKKLEAFTDHYFLFDCPGQVELYTHNETIRTILNFLQKKDFRLVAVHLVDSHYCTDLIKYVSVLLVSLKTMLLLELPHVNVLSKIDLMESYGELDFPLEFYTEVMDLSRLVERLDQDAIGKRYHSLTKALCELVEEFGLVAFHPLMIEDKVLMLGLLHAIDKAGGYIYGGLSQDNQSIQMTAVQIPNRDELVDYIQEKYIADFTAK